VRAQLKGKVTVIDRIVPLGHFGHNKFVVFCDSEGTPQRVLTGSTNWTCSGLCTQANNALIVDDPGVAADFWPPGTASRTPATPTRRARQCKFHAKTIQWMAAR